MTGYLPKIKYNCYNNGSETTLYSADSKMYL